MNERFKPYVAVLMMLIKDDSILLLRRANTGWADGNYTIPSGHIDEGEGVISAGIRETKEEVGINVHKNSITFAHVLYRKDQNDERVYVDFFLKASNWSGEPSNIETGMCDEVKWFKLDNLPENIVPFVRDAIQAHSSNVYFSEVGWNELPAGLTR